MATKKTVVFEPLIKRVDRLARELELAIRWDRPSILLAVYSSMYVMGGAAAALAARLREEGQATESVQVTNEADADVPQRLANHPRRDRTVFFVSGLQWGGKTALRALNIRREYFVDQRLRVVFWLTENEAVSIAREAPDFWAFRHRVVEFVEPPEPGLAAAVAREMAWRDFEELTLREDTQAKIALREALLAELPESEETLAARAELQYTLGGLYWANRQYERAEKSFRVALEGARRTDNTRLEAWCHNGLGNVYETQGDYEQALAFYQQALERQTDDKWKAISHSDIGDVYRALGRYEEAIAEYQRAIELNPKSAYLHHGLGNVYYTLGRHEEAVAEYQRALELDPKHAPAYFNWALAEVRRNNLDAALKQLKRAIILEPEEVIKRTKEASDFDSIRHDPRFQKLLSEGSDTSA